MALLSPACSSYFAFISVHKNVYDPRTTLSGRKVCVGGGCWLKVNIVLRFGPKLDFGFGF